MCAEPVPMSELPAAKRDNNILHVIVDDYALEIDQIDRLYSGEGCNYFVVDDTGNKYILKVHKIEEEATISFVTAVLNFLEETAINVQFPQPVRNRRGRDYTQHSDKILVVLEWIEGRTLEHIDAQRAEALGEVVCILDDRLCEFYDTHERDYSKYEDSIWNVTNIHQYDADLETIRHLLGEHYGLIKDTIAHFDTVYPTIQSALDRSLIHNDLNPDNLLYDQNLELSGIIDFTEICHVYRICEVGVALAYLMQIGGDDYLSIGQSFIRGYAKGYRFTRVEQSHLLLTIKLRLSLTLIYNTMRLHSAKALTDVQARFIHDSKKLLTELSDTTSDEFIAKVFSPAQ
jgi:Ser/Thr protein kinase RdoA (MazF antagonist)